MKKIAFINQRYGLEVNGGSEYYTRLIAEQLSDEYEVEVLTTKAVSYEDWSNYYEKDEEDIHRVHVRRFSVACRRRTFWMKVLSKLIRTLHMNYKWLGDKWVKAQGPYSPELIRYIREHKDRYDVFVFVTYLYYPAVMGLPEVKDKAVLIPTAHDEPYIYFRTYRELFESPRAFVYLTEEEKEFVNQLFHNESISSVVTGVGVDVPEDVDNRRFREQYGISGEYLIYVGRVDISKGCEQMIEYFERYSQVHPDVTLVIMGQKFMEIPESPRIRYLGFVSEQEKFDGIAGATALWLPSQFESLSISVLEAMTLAVPVLVNGKCEVLKGHCKKSNGGFAYEDEMQCTEAIDVLINDSQLRNQMGEAAQAYVETNYSWTCVKNAIKEILEGI